MRFRGVLGNGALSLAMLCLCAAPALAQTQIKPRVMIMVDTSGSMTNHLIDDNDTGGDGSTLYKDPVMTRSGLYRGLSLPNNACTDTTFDGVNSRLFAAKAALTSVVNGSGDIDWGLMRYVGNTTGGRTDGVCAVNATNFTVSGRTCTTDADCNAGQYCGSAGGPASAAGKCFTDTNLCGGNAYTRTDLARQQCGNHGVPITYAGACGATGTGGACNTVYTCSPSGNQCPGKCQSLNGSAAFACTCAADADCPGGAGGPWTCQTGVCTYNLGCVPAGGSILADPATGNSSQLLLSYADGVEDWTTNPINPELRASGNTPLAGAARTATAWYKSTIANDAKAQCRPYVLVQMTDGEDTCEDGTTHSPARDNGPVAAAQGFVAATVPGNAGKPLNKVYVIGLAVTDATLVPILNNMAKAGGTGTARFASSQTDIEAALADIVSSSVLVEKCNGIDDDCNGQCDETFPDVAVTDPSCTNRHPANSCNNGFKPGTHCFSQGVFACSADQLSEQCNAVACNAALGASIVAGAPAGRMRVSGVSNVTTNDVGRLVTVANAASAGNNGTFVIAAVGANFVDVIKSGAAAVVPDAANGKIAYALTSLQGKVSAIANVGGKERLTVGTVANVSVGAVVNVAGATNAANNGSFTVVAVGTNTIDLDNAASVNEATSAAQWNDIQFCPAVESCNGLDDDCDGIIDNCGDSVAGSCCASRCPACAKPPFIETCNNCDDDCDGIIDNHTIDTGSACGSDVGDCRQGLTACCQQDPNASGGACTQSQTGAGDRIFCAGGNPGFPKPADLCDGTDDNCDGVVNGVPPRVCYTDGAGNTVLTPAQDGQGQCHHGTQTCNTAPLASGGCGTGFGSKPCPNPTPSYGACSGAVGPSPEICDGLDNDCSGVIDDHLSDPWAQPGPANQCCPTGNLADCTNSNGSTTCKMGAWQCVAGVKTCVGGVAKTPEVCDTVDNDCNGVVDDVPGRGSFCTGTGPDGKPVLTAGPCVAKLDCVGGHPGAPEPLACVQVVGPSPETCNSIDDNCDGFIDNPPPGGSLPGVGVACDQPIAPADKPPCKAGSTLCIAGEIVCQGAVHPQPNVCSDGVSRDCTGLPNTHGDCPDMFECFQGNCVPHCGPGEFPCAGGYVCETTRNLCIPDACADKKCPDGTLCRVGSDGSASCFDPCTDVHCPVGFACKAGACVDDSCRTKGCPDGQNCVGDPPMCKADPCANKVCGPGQFCSDGECVMACIGPCMKGEFCKDGQCAPDPCAKVACAVGQTCVVQQGVGVCADDQCGLSCGDTNGVCCGGGCIADPCRNMHCPEDTECRVTSACAPTCETKPPSAKDQIVGAGGGGFGCGVAGGGAPRDGGLALSFLVLLGLGLRARRRGRQVEVAR